MSSTFHYIGPHRDIIAPDLKVCSPPFRFLDLPAELRLKVYDFHFNRVRGCWPSTDADASWSRRQIWEPWDPPNKLRLVSRMIYRESLATYYRVTPFQFKNLTNLYSFLHSLDTLDRSLITKISFAFVAGSIDPFETFDILHQCTGLKVLNIDLRGGRVYKYRTGSVGCYVGRLLMTMGGLDRLLQLRGLTVGASHTVHSQCYDDLNMFMKALDIMKQPKDDGVPNERHSSSDDELW